MKVIKHMKIQKNLQSEFYEFFSPAEQRLFKTFLRIKCSELLEKIIFWESSVKLFYSYSYYMFF